MISFMNILNQTVSLLVTIVYVIISSVTGLIAGFNTELPVTPADFSPVLRFCVCSDVHLNAGDGSPAEDEKFRALFDDVYAYSERQNYKSLDALVVAGDFTGSGVEEQYKKFLSIVDEKINDGTQLLCCMGNHEFIKYRDEDASVGYDVYKKFISEDVDTHTIINGYHFIGVSYSDDGKTFTDKMLWLEKQISDAEKDTPDMPVFVYQHPHPFSTVYGSVNWSDFAVRLVLTKHPSVVDFSGHSHYASNDPRSVWQGSFTAVGTGAVTTLMTNQGYIAGDNDVDYNSGSCWIVEADKEGNIHLMDYDLVSHKFFESADYYLKNVSDPHNHLNNWVNYVSLDTEPVFPENASLLVSLDDEGNSILSIPEASARFGTENYKIVVYKGIFNKTFSDTVPSAYCCVDKQSTEVNLGKLESGTYKVRVTPNSPYAKSGKALKTEFIIGE